MSLQIITRASEVRLMEALADINEPSEWQVVHLHLDRLLEQYKSEYQTKIAINLIHDLLKAYEGGIFLMNDGSLLIVCSRMEKNIQNKLIFQLRYLYMDDPLAYTEDGLENSDFCTLYDLRDDWERFHEESTRRMALSVRKQTGGGKPLPVMSANEPPIPKPPKGLSAERLASIERELKNADLSDVVHRQPVCVVMPDMSMRRVFDELYIHINQLRQLLKSDVDLLSNRWLFKYITQLLDVRVLDMVKRDAAKHLASPVSLNLNMETLLSSTFAEFDAAMKPNAKVSMVLEVPVVDLFADMNAFMVAKQEAQKQGYRICLDGLTAASFSKIGRGEFGLDLLKVQWNADSLKDLNSEENKGLAAAVKSSGSNRVILCRCDNRQAIEYGQALGISLFQGRYIDSVLNPTSNVSN